MTTKATLEVNGKSYEFPLFEECTCGEGKENLPRFNRTSTVISVLPLIPITCTSCQGTGYDLSKPIYYTPEKYREITGDWPMEDVGLFYHGIDKKWHKNDDVVDLAYCMALNIVCVIHFMGQSAPPPIDYKG